MFITFLVGLAPERNMNSQFTATGSKVATFQRFIVIKLIHDKLFLQQQTKPLHIPPFFLLRWKNIVARTRAAHLHLGLFREFANIGRANILAKCRR
jgi:hypothetical protein